MDKIEEIATVISDKMIELGYGMSGIETDLARAAYEVMTHSDGEVAELVAKAAPLLACDHRANGPNPRVNGERIVGFVIGENDIGLGLSEPLFALDALVKLAALTQSSVQPDRHD